MIENCLKGRISFSVKKSSFDDKSRKIQLECTDLLKWSTLNLKIIVVH